MHKLLIHVVNSNFLLGLSAAFLSMVFVNNPIDYIAWGVFVFSAVFFIYGLHRLIKWKFEQLPIDWAIWQEKSVRLMLLLLGIQLFLLGYLAYTTFYNSFDVYSLLVVILTVGYLSPFQQFTIRKIPYTKAFFVASAWTFVLIIFPSSVIHDYPSDTYFRIGFFFYFAHLAILSDIKDKEIDPREWRTFPNRFGVKNAKRGSFLLAFLAVVFFSVSVHVVDGAIIGALYLISWLFIERCVVKSNYAYDNLIWLLAGLFFIFRLL
jgi:hypothetical protein